MRKLGMCLMVGLLVAVSQSFGAWRGDAWQNNAGDLNGTSNIQSAIDNLDARLDAAGQTSETAGANALTGTSVRVSTAVGAGTTVSAGTAVSAGTSVDAGTYVSAYTYSCDVSTNITGQVYCNVSADKTWTAPASSYTQTFAVTYIATPQVFYRYTTAGIPATNGVTVATNQFVVEACQTSLSYMVRGRIK